MSGIELAGLVLGALPIVIAGLEAYNEGLDPIKAFYRWERELPHFIHQLRLQHVHYEQTVKLLFSPITTETQLARMISDPVGAWSDDELADKLKYKLNEAYGAYEATMSEIERIMCKIAGKLDLERAKSVSAQFYIPLCRRYGVDALANRRTARSCLIWIPSSCA
jgi:hypothetical protein